MGRYLIAYAAGLVVFLALDFAWLGYLARDLYRTQFGPLLLDQPRFGIAAAFYALYVVGIVIFAVAPALEAQSLRPALVYGALFGLFCYATYNLSNMATLRGWPSLITVVDMTWGTALTATCAAAAYWVASRF